jgi:hypothetical protein
MIGIVFIGLLIWSDQTRRRWVYYRNNYLFFCELESENLESLAASYQRIYHYCGMTKPERRSEAEWRNAEAKWRAGVIEELEHFRDQKLKYDQAMWRPWLPIDPDAYTAK